MEINKFENDEIQAVADYIVPNEYKNNKVFAVMFFMTELELGISQIPNKWVNINNRIFEGENAGARALSCYADTPCPASQLIDAKDMEELKIKMDDMLHNFNDEEWLTNNLYPYL